MPVDFIDCSEYPRLVSIAFIVGLTIWQYV